MDEWYWVLMFGLVGGAFLLGRWCGIRDFEKEMERATAKNEVAPIDKLIASAKEASENEEFNEFAEDANLLGQLIRKVADDMEKEKK